MLVEIEAGVTRNEPVTYAVRKAIEKAVVDMINAGAKKELWEFDVPVIEVIEPAGDKTHLDKKVIHPQYDITVDIGDEVIEKTYEMYLEEKKLKQELEDDKVNKQSDEKLIDAADEEAWNQIEDNTEEQDEKTDNDSSDSSNANPNQ
jgi:hypothetical protein